MKALYLLFVEPSPFCFRTYSHKMQATSRVTRTVLLLGIILVGADGARLGRIVEGIAKSRKDFTFISMINHGIVDDGAIKLANALKNNNVVERIDLRGNNIGDEGALAFAEALKVNRKLRSLNLQDNDIGDEGAKAIIHVMQENRVLNELHLYGNPRVHIDYLYAAEYCGHNEDSCRDLHTWSREKLGTKSHDHHHVFFVPKDETLMDAYLQKHSHDQDKHDVLGHIENERPAEHVLDDSIPIPQLFGKHSGIDTTTGNWEL